MRWRTGGDPSCLGHPGLGVATAWLILRGMPQLIFLPMFPGLQQRQFSREAFSRASYCLPSCPAQPPHPCHPPLPRRAIAAVIMQQYGADRWGDFKGTLLGLLTACGAELSILQCANRVVAAGARWAQVCSAAWPAWCRCRGRAARAGHTCCASPCSPCTPRPLFGPLSAQPRRLPQSTPKGVFFLSF